MALKKEKIRIMVFGTFDGVHSGHLHFFRQAKRLVKKTSEEAFLIVSIARDTNVFKIKGRKPILNEKKRIILVKKISLVDKVVLSGIKNHLIHIIKERPSVIALGYDQLAYVKNLKKDLKNNGVLVKVVRLKPYKEKIYKNSLIRKKNG